MQQKMTFIASEISCIYKNSGVHKFATPGLLFEVSIYDQIEQSAYSALCRVLYSCDIWDRILEMNQCTKHGSINKVVLVLWINKAVAPS